MTTRLVRLSIFWILALFWIVVMSFAWVDIYTTDDCLVAYTFDMMLSFSCLIAYLWYWKKMGHASTVYVAVTTLFAGTSFSLAMQFYVRYLGVHHAEMYQVVLESPMWAWRGLPRYLAMSYMFSIITARLITGRKDDE